MGATKIVIASALALSWLIVVSGLAQAADSSASKSSPASGSGSSSSSATHQTATQARQSSTALAGSIASMVLGSLVNMAPLALLLGVGAMMLPSLGMSAMGLLRESRRSSNEQPQPNLAAAFQSPFGQYARPLQSSPQDIYYFTKRSLPSLMSNVNTAGLMRGMQDVLERVVRAIENADKRYS